MRRQLWPASRTLSSWQPGPTAGNRFDVARTRSKIFTFGAGPYYCLGANLARVILQVALQTLAERAPGLRLGCALDDVEWDLGSAIPFVKRLPIRVKS